MSWESLLNSIISTVLIAAYHLWANRKPKAPVHADSAAEPGYTPPTQAHLEPPVKP